MQMILNFDQNVSYTAGSEQVLAILSEKLPAEVKRLFARCSEVLISGNAATKNNSGFEDLELSFWGGKKNTSPVLNENGTLMGMKTGLTSKKEALNIMKINGYDEYFTKRSRYYFAELEFSLLFDEKDILSEITLEKGSYIMTTKGLQVGDTIEKAVEIYGQPRFQAIVSAMWSNNLAVSIKDGYVTAIRAQAGK